MWSQVYDAAQQYLNTPLHYAAAVLVGIGYIALVGYLIIGPDRWRRWQHAVADDNGVKPPEAAPASDPLLDGVRQEESVRV